MVVKCFKGGFSQKGLPGQWLLALRKTALPGHGSAECFPRLLLFFPLKATEAFGKDSNFLLPSLPTAQALTLFLLIFSIRQDNLITAFQPGSLRKPCFPGQAELRVSDGEEHTKQGQTGSGTRRRSRRKLGFNA